MLQSPKTRHPVPSCGSLTDIIQLLTGDEGNICYVGPEDKLLPEAVLLYLHWFRIKYSIQQTDHDQTGLNLDELIWDELALM